MTVGRTDVSDSIRAEFLMELPDADVRKQCRAAMSTHITDQERLDALALLIGFRSKSAIATALLACYDPEEFGVLDRRALEGLRRIERPIARGRGAAGKRSDTWIAFASSHEVPGRA